MITAFSVLTDTFELFSSAIFNWAGLNSKSDIFNSPLTASIKPVQVSLSFNSILPPFNSTVAPLDITVATACFTKLFSEINNSPLVTFKLPAFAFKIPFEFNSAKFKVPEFKVILPDQLSFPFTDTSPPAISISVAFNKFISVVDIM